jgi:hypothetical protein
MVPILSQFGLYPSLPVVILSQSPHQLTAFSIVIHPAKLSQQPPILQVLRGPLRPLNLILIHHPSKIWRFSQPKR